jgi:Ankyrin repeat
MNDLSEIVNHFETHNVQGIKNCFENGLNPNSLLNNKPLIYEFINMYARGPRFSDCIKVFSDYGLVFEDRALLAVLSNDPVLLKELIGTNKNIVSNKYSFDCAFTPLCDVPLLHICAEYNHVLCAEVLLGAGADINARAASDEYGFGGHTAIFHTVNQDANKSIDILRLLILHGADLDLTVRGLIWGKGYAWETFVPSVNVISYAMMGLLRQFQRTESQIYEVVAILLKAKYGIDYSPKNIPNKYLHEDATTPQQPH